MSDAMSITAAEAALLKREGLDTVAGAFDCAGGEALDKPGLGGRERIRLRLTDGAGGEVLWYLKRYGDEHHCDGSGHCCCVLPSGRASPARRELEGISRLRAAGVPTMRAVAFGEETNLWGLQRSYLVVEAVPGDALERCLDDFLARRGGDPAAMDAFGAALVGLVAALHGAGLAHRDLYASHIFLDEGPDGVTLSLIDAARVFAPRWRRFRWRAKDLAALKYSMPAGWTQPHWDGFLDAYVARIGGGRGRWAGAVDRKVASLRRRQRRRQRRLRRRGGPE